MSERIDAFGPRVLVSTACAAGGNCIGLARDKIITGEADVVLAGGVDPLQFGTYAGFSGLRALSPEPCRPYSASAGLNLGEGAGFLVVERADTAAARGAQILATVAGYGLSADAYHATAPDPTGRGGTTAVRRALADAELDPTDVDYVCGHGTGTPANDSMERKVMRNVFGEEASKVPISGIKSFFGHTLGAAGAIEGVASVLAIMHQTAPPTIGWGEAEPATTRTGPTAALDFVPNHAREMDIDTVVSNNYAFGGNNVAVVLRRPGVPVAAPKLSDEPVVVTGLGPVTSAGVGIGPFAAALAAMGAGESIALPEQVDLGTRTYAPRSVWRQANNLSRLAIAASRLAWEDASLELNRAELERVGVMFATAAGSQESVASYDESVLADPNSPGIHSFSNVVLNATGGAVCQALGVRGPTTTICNGATSTTIALDCATETIRSGKAEVVLIVAADEEAVQNPPDGLPSSPIPTRGGAVAMVVESAAHAAQRSARPYAVIAASRNRGVNSNSDHIAGHPEWNLENVKQMFSGEPLQEPPLAVALESTSIRRLPGVVGSVVSGLDLVAAAATTPNGDSALVHAVEPSSTCGSVLLERSPT